MVQATVLDGLTTREAGRLLGIPAGTVKTRIMRERNSFGRHSHDRGTSSATLLVRYGAEVDPPDAARSRPTSSPARTARRR